VTGALKARTATGPNVWTPVGSTTVVSEQTLASNAETIAGIVDDKAVTPAGLEARSTDIDPRKYGFATTATGIVNSAALQAAIDEACGTANPVTTTRVANRRIVLPAGTYLLNNQINIRSVMNLEIIGHGNCILQANANMTSVFDINGAAYSRFGGFTIIGTAGVQVDNAIFTYWDATGSQRSNTRNCYHDLTIRNLDYIVGMRVGKPGVGAVQVDNDEFRNIGINGGWTTGNTTRWQQGLYLGTGTAGNNLLHHVYALLSILHRYNLYVDSTQVDLHGACFGNGETDVFTGVTGYVTLTGVRSETSERFLKTGGPTTAAPMISLSDIMWSADAMNADGKWIDLLVSGTIVMRNLALKNAAIIPKISVGAGANPIELLVNGLSVFGPVSPVAVASLFTLVSSASTVRVRGYAAQSSAASTVSVGDWDSDAVAASYVQGFAPPLSGRSGEYWGSPVVKSTTALLTGTMYVFSVYVPFAVTLDRIGAEVTVLAAGSTLTLGIYNDDGGGLPGTLLLDAGTIDGGTVAAQEKTINQVLQAGRLYHFAALCQGGTPTVRTLNGAWTGFNSSLANAVGSSAVIRSGRNRGAVIGAAFPTPFGSASVSSAVPSIAVRFA
jgi:hypothetical protein